MVKGTDIKKDSSWGMAINPFIGTFFLNIYRIYMMPGFPQHGKDDHEKHHFLAMGLKLVRSLTCSGARCSMGPYLRDSLSSALISAVGGY